MYREASLCEQYGHILGGKGVNENGVCSVNFQRRFPVKVQGHSAVHLDEVELWFQLLDGGNALNFGEVAVLQNELPGFTSLLLQQRIIVSAIHNHWIFTVPEILYVHFQSIEPPLNFARKVSHAFAALQNYPPRQW